MILSMTGFGRGSAISSSKRFTVDLKSLNSKQLDLSMRVPVSFKELELDARSIIAESLERGKVDLNTIVEQIVESSHVQINAEVLASYKSQIEAAAQRLEIPYPADWYQVLMRLPDVLKTEVPSLDPEDKEAFLLALRAAVDALVEFRIAEGKKLHAFFLTKIKNIGDLLEQVTPFESKRVAKIRARLEEQLARLSSIDYDRGRLEQELIFYIEKLDVTEEKIRLRSHLNYFLETLGAVDDGRPHQGQGKKLGFIAQEMGREINTLGSKSNDADMQKIVVKMKDELEQIKEQVLNVL